MNAIDLDLARNCQRALDIAAANRLFGRDPLDLDRAMHAIVQRAANRTRVRALVSEARSALRRLNERGIYSAECWAYEEDAKAKTMDAIEAFHARHEF